MVYVITITQQLAAELQLGSMWGPAKHSEVKDLLLECDVYPPQRVVSVSERLNLHPCCSRPRRLMPNPY